MDVDKLPDAQGFSSPPYKEGRVIELHTGNMRPDQVDEKFLQGMINRLAVGFHRYGPLDPKRANWVETIKLRLDAYKETGNIDFLIDVANFAMFEWRFPQLEGAHSDPSAPSPGIIAYGTNEHRKGSVYKPAERFHDHEGD
jgi:hypothetical protein